MDFPEFAGDVRYGERLLDEAPASLSMMLRACSLRL
jgi:hypothetical protein